MGHKRRRQRRQAHDRQQQQMPISWPPAGKPVEQFSDGELNAIALHPMVTGIGQHPRTVADADYIASCLKLSNEYGPEAFIYGMFELLYGTQHFGWAMPNETFDPTVAPPPIRQEMAKTLSIPMSLVDFPGERDVPQDQWTPGMVMGMGLNPVYAGIVWPAMVSPEVWMTAMGSHVGQVGIVQAIVDLVYILKYTFGACGVSHGHVPYGYPVSSEHDDDESPEE